MKKSMLTALLVVFMHATLFALPTDMTAPIRTDTVVPIRIDTVVPIRTDTVVPIRTTLVSQPLSTPRPHPAIILRAYNTTGKGLPNVLLEWELLTNGVIHQKGTIPYLSITSQQSLLIRLPIRMPPGNEETFLHLRYFISRSSAAHSSSATHSSSAAHLSSETHSSSAAHSPPSALIAEEWLPLRTWDGSSTLILPAGEMSFTDDDGSFTILSRTIHIRFSKQTGWLQQYEIRGYNLLEDSTELRPDFRKTDTPRGPWVQVTRNPRLQLFSTSTGSEIVIVRTEYTLPETYCHLHLSYTINATGEMEIGQSIEADSAEQGWPLPRFGMQWTLPAPLDSISAYGRFSKKTVDSTTNRPPAEIYHPMIEDDQPAEYPAIRWCKISGRDGRGLQITADSGLLNLSMGPRTGKLLGLSLNIDYPPAVIDYPPGAGPRQLPYASYCYGFKVSAVGPEASPRRSATSANSAKPLTPTKRQP